MMIMMNNNNNNNNNTSSDSSYTSSCSTSSCCNNNNNNNQRMPDRDFNYTPSNASERAVAKGGVACPFPWRLHEMLKVAAEENLEHVVSWAPHGKAFTVHNPKEFVDKLMTRFFCQSKFASFQRQLNLYGFSRFCHGRDKGAYWHPCFIKEQRHLVRHMIRRKIKGSTATLRRPLPTEEPDFYNERGCCSDNSNRNSNNRNNNNNLNMMSWSNSYPYHRNNNEAQQHQHQQSTLDYFASSSLEPLPHDQQQDQHTVSPVPPYVSFQNNEAAFSTTTTTTTQPIVPEPEPLVTRRVSETEPQDLGFFEGSPFHFLEELAEEPVALPEQQPQQQQQQQPPQVATLLDPAAELAKIRAQIRQKQAEYEQTISKRLSSSSSPHQQQQQPAFTNGATTTATRRVSFEAPTGGGIPVYKGSYISV